MFRLSLHYPPTALLMKTNGSDEGADNIKLSRRMLFVRRRDCRHVWSCQIYPTVGRRIGREKDVKGIIGARRRAPLGKGTPIVKMTI